MILGQPLLQSLWQQQLLVGVVGKVGLAHIRLPATGLGLSYPQPLAQPCFSDRLLEQDPKTVIAMENLDAFPIDLSTATKDQLLRIHGIGPVSAGRILENRRQDSVDNWRGLQAMGVVRKRAWLYVAFPVRRSASSCAWTCSARPKTAAPPKPTA